MILDRVHGFANIFRETSQPIGPGPEIRARILPGAFNLDVSPITLNVMHADNVRFASTSDGSLHLWQCDFGLAFAAEIPATPLGAGLRSAIASGATCAMSIGFQILASERLSFVNGPPVHIVSKAALNHISICDSGAFPSACCWLGSLPASDMPPDLQAIARRWRMGRAAHENMHKMPTPSPTPSPARSSSRGSAANQQRPTSPQQWFQLFNIARHSPAQWAQLLRATELNSRERVRAGRR